MLQAATDRNSNSKNHIDTKMYKQLQMLNTSVLRLNAKTSEFNGSQWEDAGGGRQ